MIKRYNYMKEENNLESWDFKKANTKEYTHVIHTYPAMMIPQIARKLIFIYGNNAKTILDPFCGSGTSIVESTITPHIKEVYGFDLNPLATLISKVKTTPIDNLSLLLQLKLILSKRKEKIIPPEFKNINYWFKPKVIKDLSKIKKSINKIKEKDIKDFFLVCFSETVRNTSNTRNNEFKLYRMPKDKLEKYNPDVFKEFEKICLKSIRGMEDYIKIKPKIKPKIKIINSMNKLPLKDKSIDLIITSPPYGDSKTTVAYGQFSRLALQWLDYPDINNLDNKLLGGKSSISLDTSIKSLTLKKIIKKISEKDKKRAKEILSFYNDFDKVVLQLNKAIKKKGLICFVVGNRTVKGINIPTDKIMVEMFHAHGNYDEVALHTRTIPNKRIPLVTSPTNVKGKTSPTIGNEFIFVLKKI